MANEFDQTPPIEIVEAPKKQSFNFSSEPLFNDLAANQLGMGMRLANHEGRMNGFDTALQAVLASIASMKQVFGAWLAAFGILVAVIILGFTIGQVAMANQGGDISKIRESQESTSARMTSLEAKVEQLPGQMSKEIRETARDLIAITRDERGKPR